MSFTHAFIRVSFMSLPKNAIGGPVIVAAILSCFWFMCVLYYDMCLSSVMITKAKENCNIYYEGKVCC